MIKTWKSPKQAPEVYYCEQCGSKLLEFRAQDWNVPYDGRTGNPNVGWYYKCPKSGGLMWLVPWAKLHTIIYRPDDSTLIIRL